MGPHPQQATVVDNLRSVPGLGHVKALRLDAAIWPPRLGELDFEKNQLFDLRTDLAHSWGRPGDWRSQKLILTTFVFEILYGR